MVRCTVRLMVSVGRSTPIPGISGMVNHETDAGGAAEADRHVAFIRSRAPDHRAPPVPARVAAPATRPEPL